MTRRILVLAEGDPETLDSWSGSSLHLIEALRRRGYEVAGRDVSERGIRRAMAMATSWAPERRRWAARFHFGSASFSARTARAHAELRRSGGSWDATLQIGATFQPVPGRPAFLYCDSNAKVAEANRPYGDVALLNPAELMRMIERERRVYAATSHVFTMSELVRGSMIRDFAVPPSHVSAVYSGANLDPAACVPRVFDPTRPPTILFVGRFWEAKGGPEVYEAFRQARSAHPGLRLVIAGCIPDLPDTAGVTLVGRIDKRAPGGIERMFSLYREADLFCMPSRFDAFGIVFVEAMLHGVACIGARHAAMPEIIAENETGWVVTLGDTSALRDRFVRALADRPGLAAMGARGRERALRLFTWDAVAERFHRVMDPILSAPAHAR